jgi:hypothetical protein
MFILKPRESFQELIADIMEEYKITSDRTARRKTGVTLLVLKHWRDGKQLPSMKSLFAFSAGLAKTTENSPQDVMDTVFESMQEWRDINRACALRE